MIIRFLVFFTVPLAFFNFGEYLPEHGLHEGVVVILWMWVFGLGIRWAITGKWRLWGKKE